MTVWIIWLTANGGFLDEINAHLRSRGFAYQAFARGVVSLSPILRLLLCLRKKQDKVFEVWQCRVWKSLCITTLLVHYCKPCNLEKVSLACWYTVPSRIHLVASASYSWRHAQHRQNHVVCIYPRPPMLPHQIFKWPHYTVWLLLCR